MKINDYLKSYHESKTNFLKNEKSFWENELKNEKLFSKFLKNLDFVVEEIIPKEIKNEEHRKHGAIIYTPDLSVVTDFKKVNFGNHYLNPYTKKFAFRSDSPMGISFYSNVKVGETELDNFEIVLRNQELSLRGYDLILEGQKQWDSFYDKKEEKRLMGLINKRIEYFKSEGMKEKLVEKIGGYLHSWARGIDPEDYDPRL